MKVQIILQIMILITRLKYLLITDRHLKVQKVVCHLPEKPRILQNMLSSPDVAYVLDRFIISDKKFTILAAAIAKAKDQELKDGP